MVRCSIPSNFERAQTNDDQACRKTLAAVVVQNSPDANSVLIEGRQNIFVQVHSYLSYLHTAVNPDKVNMLSSNFVLNTYLEEQSIAVARFERSSKITDK